MAVVHVTSTTALLHAPKLKAAPTRLSRADFFELGHAELRHATVHFAPEAGWALEYWGGDAPDERVLLTDGATFNFLEYDFRFELLSRTDAFDETLEDALFDAPDREDTWLVYADWLQEHGNPLGECIAKNEAGPLPPMPCLTPRWTRGVLTEAVLQGVSADAFVSKPARLVCALHNTPTARMLRRLTIDVPSFVPERDERRLVVHTLQTLARYTFRGLRELQFHVRAASLEDEVGDAQLAVKRAHPRLSVSFDVVKE